MPPCTDFRSFSSCNNDCVKLSRFPDEGLLALLGSPIGEMFDLEALTKHCIASKRWTFHFTSWPLALHGGAASPAVSMQEEFLNFNWKDRSQARELSSLTIAFLSPFRMPPLSSRGKTRLRSSKMTSIFYIYLTQTLSFFLCCCKCPSCPP